MTPDDIVTKKDLDQLKQELFDFLRPIVDAQGLQQQKWLRSKDVRKLLNISAGTLQNLRVNGMLGYRKAGSIFFYKAEDIDKMLADPEKKSPKRKL
ncbi:helix-turn-helix domain-containing protein [Mucilaginibacter gynuensis]|uniref:Helix-turn-helix domain-containing protein n=1 Tax=Mucilaginibacter gynuensis TaxID=1302236 RepID=A0ABP8HDG7_9SPHI